MRSMSVNSVTHHVSAELPPEAIELYLTSGIADAVLERRDGWSLLHECAKQGIVTPVIMKALRHHIDRSDI